MKRIIAFIVTTLLIVSGAAAQSPKTATVPKADGVLVPGEYPVVKTGSGISLGVALSEDGKTLYLAVQAPTAGWVAFGAGSLKMNGAYMVLAFDANGKPTISEQTGKAHGHSPNATLRLSASAVKEADGVTTLEAALPSEGLVSPDAIKLIAAFGRADNLTSLHKGYFSVEVAY